MTFLKRLGVSNGFPFFSLYQALRWFTVSTDSDDSCLLGDF